MKTKILLITALVVLSSCSVFRVVPEENYTAQSIEQYENDGKYLVLQRGEEAWHIYELNAIGDTLYARLDFQIGYHVKYLSPKEKGLNQFNKKAEPEVVNAVHIYTADTNFSSFDTLVAFPLNSITGVNIYSYARAPSRASKIVPVVLIPLVGLIIISVISLQNMSINMTF